jgi:signal transduction histidine kinase
MVERIELVGGRISLVSTPGKGSEVEVAIPSLELFGADDRDRRSRR